MIKGSKDICKEHYNERVATFTWLAVQSLKKKQCSNQKYFFDTMHYSQASNQQGLVPPQKYKTSNTQIEGEIHIYFYLYNSCQSDWCKNQFYIMFLTFTMWSFEVLRLLMEMLLVVFESRVSTGTLKVYESTASTGVLYHDHIKLMYIIVLYLYKQPAAWSEYGLKYYTWVSNKLSYKYFTVVLHQ